MQRRIRPDLDIILDILKEVATVKPGSGFIQSLLLQYQERGGLSKKQLQGLAAAASKVPSISPNKLATLEAIILKKPTRNKSDRPLPAPVFEKDQRIGNLIAGILEKYPGHKRVLFFHSKFENNEPLSPLEVSELEKFARLLK